MSNWDARFLAMIDVVASWSKDPSTQVGAAIVDPKNRIVSIGFNGFPRGVSDNPALLFASRSVDGCTIYVTHPPCARCAAKLVQVGIARVVTRQPDPQFVHRWDSDMVSTRNMLMEAGVVFEQVNYE